MLSKIDGILHITTTSFVNFCTSINFSTFIEKTFKVSNFLFKLELVPSCITTHFSSELGYLNNNFSFSSVVLSLFEWIIVSLGTVPDLILAVIKLILVTLLTLELFTDLFTSWFLSVLQCEYLI